MFERLVERVRRTAATRAEAKVRTIGEELGAALPPGLRCEAEADGVAIVGRGLKRRYVIDQRLRHVLGRRQ